MIKGVDAVVVTRGNEAIAPVMISLKQTFENVILWNNRLGPNMGPFGQFLAACYLTDSDLVYFQDDDCVVSRPGDIVKAWTPGKIVCNLGTQGHRANYENRLDKLMGFGSCFEVSLIKKTFERYWVDFPIDHITWREPGRIFTAMNHENVVVVEVPFQNMPWATAGDRLYKQSDHMEKGNEAIRRVKEVIGWEEK